MNSEEMLKKATEWLFNLRKLAQDSALIANALLDTQPEGLSLSTLGSYKPDPMALNQLEKDAVHQGKAILAIKEHRTRTGFGLKESKDAVDNYRKTLTPGTPGAFPAPSLPPLEAWER